jgi:hypothetical protein
VTDRDVMPGGDGVRVVSSMRVVLAAAAALVFLAGIPLFVFPTETERYFAWTVASPMTATFLGAAYWSALVLELSAATARTWDEARIAVPAVFVFTVLTLIVTLVHLEQFHLDAALDGRTRAIAVGWLGIYAVVPVAMLAAAARQGRTTGAADPADGLPHGLRLALGGQAAVLLGLGVALLVAPTWADAAWPWPLTPLTGRAVGAWLVGLGVASGHALLVGSARSLRPLGLAGVAFALLEAVALARYGEELTWASFPAVAYVAGLAMVGATGGWLLRSGAAPRGRPGRPAAARDAPGGR